MSDVSELRRRYERSIAELRAELADARAQSATDARIMSALNDDANSYVEQLRQTKAERDALQARLTAVLALHFARGRNILGQPVCNECSPLQPMPCPTVRAAASGQEG